MTTPGPFITPADELMAQSKSPKVIGQRKIIALANTVNINMTDDQIAAVCSKIKETRDLYLKWEEFYNDLAARKQRLLAFMAIVSILDTDQIATELQTTPEVVKYVMTGRAMAEQTRLNELAVLWATGQLPDRPVLTEPLPDLGSAVSPVSSSKTAEPTEPTADSTDS